jgi:hypothetical protein
MKYIKLSEWTYRPERNIYHFYRNCLLHVASYLVANNLNKQDIVLYVDKKYFSERRKLSYFSEALKEFVSDVKILKEEEDIDVEIVDTKKYRNYQSFKQEIESLELYKNNSREVKDIIFIRRKFDRDNLYNRGITNEEELIDELKKEHGGNVIDVYLEDLPFQEQVKLMRGCKLLIGCHGAGLANLLWMNSGASILELFPESFFWGSFWTFSCLKRLNYDFLQGKDIMYSGITLEQFAKENGICLCCLRNTHPRSHTKYLQETEFIYLDEKWNSKTMSEFNRNLRERQFQIDKDQFIKKVNNFFTR